MEGRRSNLVPLGSILDVRPLDAALTAPFCFACHIPLAELKSRVFELPPKGALVQVAESGRAGSAVEVLESLDRRASVVAPTHADSFEQHRLWRPSAFVEEVISAGSGHVLDLGCGSGRNALYLAGLGYEVTALDSLPDANLDGAGFGAAVSSRRRRVLDRSPSFAIRRFAVWRV